MSKILTTQLSGLLQRITQNEEDAIEETARLLAQAPLVKDMSISLALVKCKRLS